MIGSTTVNSLDPLNYMYGDNIACIAVTSNYKTTKIAIEQQFIELSGQHSLLDRTQSLHYC